MNDVRNIKNIRLNQANKSELAQHDLQTGHNVLFAFTVMLAKIDNFWKRIINQSGSWQPVKQVLDPSIMPLGSKQSEISLIASQSNPWHHSGLGRGSPFALLVV